MAKAPDGSPTPASVPSQATKLANQPGVRVNQPPPSASGSDSSSSGSKDTVKERAAALPEDAPLGRSMYQPDKNDTLSDLYKRTLPEPSDGKYKGDMNHYISDEYIRKPFIWVPHRMEGRLSSAIYPWFGGNHFNMAVSFLYGCTSVIIASKRGAYMTHFWQEPSMQYRFGNDIEHSLIWGDGPDMPSIWTLWANSRGSGQIFEVTEDNEIHMAILTPRPEDSNDPSDYMYPAEVRSLRNILVGDSSPFKGQGEPFIW